MTKKLEVSLQLTADKRILIIFHGKIAALSEKQWPRLYRLLLAETKGFR